MHNPHECSWCKEALEVSTMSKFSTDMICLRCKDFETKHPKYQEACQAEEAALREGNPRFEGIGVPPDLFEDAWHLRVLCETAGEWITRVENPRSPRRSPSHE